MQHKVKLTYFVKEHTPFQRMYTYRYMI